MKYSTIESLIGNTPLIQLQKIQGKTNNHILLKIEGNNPGGSIKDRPVLGMILGAEKRGEISPGDTLIEATSGNTGIALAMISVIRGYNMILIMQEIVSKERQLLIKSYGSKIVIVSKEKGIEGARDLAMSMAKNGKGKLLEQFSNEDNPLSHYNTTGPEIWHGTNGKITHFITTMGTTGTLMGVSKYLKEKNKNIKAYGAWPINQDHFIPGTRHWSKEYMPKIYKKKWVDKIFLLSQYDAESMTVRLAKEEGILCGISSGGAVSSALLLSKSVTNATIVVIVADRGDRYISTGIFNN